MKNSKYINLFKIQTVAFLRGNLNLKLYGDLLNRYTFLFLNFHCFTKCLIQLLFVSFTKTVGGEPVLHIIKMHLIK